MAQSRELHQFEDITDEDLEALRNDLVPKNTRKAEAKCERILMCYLESKGKDPNYWL